MRKILFRLNLFLILFYFACNPKADDQKKNKEPNVVVIFIDDMGYADPGCFGNPLISTPNIDKLAADGLRLTNFYASSPICSPSRAALLTGQYPMRHKIHSFLNTRESQRNRKMNDYLDPNVPTLAKTLKENGYTTGHFGKWHLGGGRDVDDAPYPTAYGFNKSFVAFEGMGDRVLLPDHMLSRKSAAIGKGNISWSPKNKLTEIYVDSALAFVKRIENKPFYINLFPNDVHDGHYPPEGSTEKFKSITDNPYEQKFLAVLEELDKQIGRFLLSLDSLGKLDNTIIIFTSDNGPTDWPKYYERDRYPDSYDGELYPPGFTGRFFGRKWSLYEGGIRMPFIVRWDGKIPKGVTDSTTIVSAIDLFPSICSMLELKYPEDLDGTDKSMALMGEPIGDTLPVMWEYGSNPGGSLEPGNDDFISPELAIRDGDWKLLMDNDSTNIELYNLKTDPGETQNLAESKPEITKELARKVLTWRREMPVEMEINR